MIGKVNKSQHQQIREKFNIELSRQKNNLTIKAHEYVWRKNLKRNAKNEFFKKSVRIEDITKRIGKDKDIMITGAGYSLETSVEEIKERKENGAIIFSTDATTKFMVDKGIVPDYIFVLDSKKIGLRFFSGIEDELKNTVLVISSAVDQDFVELFPLFKEVIGFHMYDPSMGEWGGDLAKPVIMEAENQRIGVLTKGVDYSAHHLLPNLEYIVNRGNVFNLAIQIANMTQPHRIYGYGAEHCYKIVDGNFITRAMIRDDTDNLDYSLGGDRIPWHKVILVRKPGNSGETVYSELAFVNYAQICMEMINTHNIPYIDKSDGLIMSNRKILKEDEGGVKK